MNSETKTILRSLSADLIRLLVVLPLQIVYAGWIAKVLWGWFVAAPLNLPEITTPNGVGLYFLFALLTKGIRYSRFEKEYRDDPDTAFARSFAYMTTILWVGYLTHLCM